MYVQQCTQLTGTNGRMLDHSYQVLAETPGRALALSGMLQALESDEILEQFERFSTRCVECLPATTTHATAKAVATEYPVNISGRSHPFPSRTR